MDEVAYPDFKPLHKAFVGTCRVAKKNLKNPETDTYRVNLTTGECTCQWGRAFVWAPNKGGWAPNSYCLHKLKALSDLCKNAGDPTMDRAYIKAVSSRYNVYETVSAFHKELRRGDTERAQYWGSILSSFRGLGGVIRYMQSIIYEETREHDLARWLLAVQSDKAQHTVANVCNAIAAFCAAPKKWELPHRYEILEAEMKGYKRLVAEFGLAVAKPSDIIDEKHKDTLLRALMGGLAENDPAMVQYGLKGLQKLKSDDTATLKGEVCERLLRQNFNVPRSFEDYIRRKVDSGVVGYHDLNALCDFIARPVAEAGAGLLTALRRKKLLNNPVLPPIPYGFFPTIPLYAQDNHTWAGKALIRRFTGELQPGAEQTHLDLRWCGAYYGVTWRHLAFRQYGTCDVPWARVKWPRWLFDTVNQLWY